MVNKKGNRQIERTRQAIISAYLEMLHESPMKKIKISEICEHANISRGTFYNHFETKDEILLTYLDEIIDEMFIEYRKLQFETKEEAFTNFSSASIQFFALWQSKAELYKLIKTVKAENLLIEKLKDHHLKTYHIIAVPQFSIDDPEMLDQFISHISYVFFSVLDEWMNTGLRRTSEEMGELLALLYKPMIIQSLSERYN